MSSRHTKSASIINNRKERALRKNLASWGKENDSVVTGKSYRRRLVIEDFTFTAKNWDFISHVGNAGRLGADK